jgi:sugar phosphate isomerase/epimerase
MKLNRRELLASVSGAAATLLGSAPRLEGAEPNGSRMGVVIHSYTIRQAADKEKTDRFDDPLTFLEYCRTLGAGGVQIALGARDETYSAKMRRHLETHQLFVEGSIRLPRDRNDVERFTNEVRTAKACGAAILRTVLMVGRRYEVFASADAFRAFQEQARKSLALAKPIVERQAMRLAIENHKDLLSAELLDVIKTVDSPFVGVCLDTGNNLALLENAEEIAATLAPHAFTTHIKDMAVQEYPEGFLLSEVPLGAGFVDLVKIVRLLRKARPDIHLNLEMITRDPLKVPCLTDKYWATLDGMSGRRLARALAAVRANAWKQPLPRVSHLKREEQIKREDDNVRACLRYARERLAA